VTIGKVVRDFRAALPDAAIYVYDNNSTDRTAEIAAAPDMVAKVLDGYDMVIGDRLSSPYFQENKRPFHNFGNRLVRSSINGLFNAHVTDIMTGYRAFSFTFVKTYPVLSHGFEVETEMTIHSLNNNLRLYEMPVQYRDRPAGSVSKLDTVGDGIKVMSTIFRMIREYKPLPFFGTIGLLIGIRGEAAVGLGPGHHAPRLHAQSQRHHIGKRRRTLKRHGKIAHKSTGENRIGQSHDVIFTGSLIHAGDGGGGSGHRLTQAPQMRD